MTALQAMQSAADWLCEASPGTDQHDRGLDLRLAVNVHRQAIEALRALYGLVEDGTLVRNTIQDAQPGWSVKQLPLIKVLASAHAAIEHENSL